MSATPDSRRPADAGAAGGVVGALSDALGAQVSDAGGAASRSGSVPTCTDVYGYVVEHVSVSDAQSATHWNCQLWHAVQ